MLAVEAKELTSKVQYDEVEKKFADKNQEQLVEKYFHEEKYQ